MLTGKERVRQAETATQAVTVVGLGKLGAAMAAAIASRGDDVVGVDVADAVIEVLNAGRAPVRETGLPELIAANRARLRATTNLDAAVAATSITFVVVPTPSDESGAFSLGNVAAVFAQIGRALKAKADYHLVVLTSTVLPGSLRFGLLPILERESGKTCGVDFGVCYSPEFIALGSVIRDFLEPDFILIGESDERAGAALERWYRRIVSNGAPVARMSLENAELTKIAVNTYVTTKISFANTIAALCERLPGGNVDVVTKALGLDSRIGPRFLTGALGFGGPCFPRDNRAFVYLAESLGLRAYLAEGTDETNRVVVGRVVGRALRASAAGARVAVLGVAYKPGSHVTEESQGLLIAQALHGAGAEVRTYDPLATEVEWHVPLAQALDEAEVIVVATPDPAFGALRQSEFAKARRGALVLDCWRIVDPEVVKSAGLLYAAVGVSGDDDSNARRLAEMWD